MRLLKQSRKDFSNFVKAWKVELQLLKETNKFLEKATNLEPLKKWYKRKFWFSSPTWMLMEAEIRQINIQIDEDWINIQWYWTDWKLYDEFSFMDEETARDVAKMVAGTYIDKLKSDKAFYEDMVKRTDEAIKYAQLPPEKRKRKLKKQLKDLEK